MTVSDRIKEKRLELQMSQSELARLAGYSDKTAISKIENAGNNITMKQLRRVAKALHVSAAYLMGWESESGETTPHGKLVDAYVVSQKKDELYSIYMELSPEKQATFEAYLKFLQSQP